MAPIGQTKGKRSAALHLARLLVFAAIVILIHWQHSRLASQEANQQFSAVELNVLRPFLPAAASISTVTDELGRRHVTDVAGQTVGTILQTSPKSDHILGFSGPTNVLVAFDPHDRIVGIDILSSGDTRDHIGQVRDDDTFLRSFDGLTWEDAAKFPGADAVSGATLTSVAIQEAIIHRLGGDRPSLRFPEPVSADQAHSLFAHAHGVTPDETHAALWHVVDNDGTEVGTILRTSPAADNLVGYQGPTDTLIGFDLEERVVGISIGKSYDNEPYVTYIREDEYFLTLFDGLLLAELAATNLEEKGVEGVSGATMTSMAVAEGIVRAAAEHQQSISRPAKAQQLWLHWSLRDYGTAAIVIAGVAIGLTSLRSHKTVRFVFQVLLIVYLGLINGDMVSQAMLVGWVQNGIPWRSAGGLVVLTAAAFLLPLTTRHNVYCHHICPHGAAQQLLRNRLPWRLSMRGTAARTVRWAPAVLLAWCVVVATAGLPFSLVDIEPFDAWVFRVAGWATITIAAVGLLASMFVPMAYCRYGCPTGALLNHVRFNSRSARWTRRDWFAVGLLVMAVVMFAHSP